MTLLTTLRKTVLGILGSLMIITHSIPAFAYYDDTHFGLTYYLARRLGYTAEQARRVSSACLAIDYSPATEPERYGEVAFGGEYSAQGPRVGFHAMLDEYLHPDCLSNEGSYKKASEDVIKQRNQLWDDASTLRNLGFFLHFHQDEFAHFGYGSWGGHWVERNPHSNLHKHPMGAYTDWLGSYTVDQHLKMAKSTSLYLKSFLEKGSGRQAELAKHDIVSDQELTSLMTDLAAANTISPPYSKVLDRSQLLEFATAVDLIACAVKFFGPAPAAVSITLHAWRAALIRLLDKQSTGIPQSLAFGNFLVRAPDYNNSNNVLRAELKKSFTDIYQKSDSFESSLPRYTNYKINKEGKLSNSKDMDELVLWGALRIIVELPQGKPNATVALFLDTGKIGKSGLVLAPVLFEKRQLHGSATLLFRDLPVGDYVVRITNDDHPSIMKEFKHEQRGVTEELWIDLRNASTVTDAHVTDRRLAPEDPDFIAITAQVPENVPIPPPYLEPSLVSVDDSQTVSINGINSGTVGADSTVVRPHGRLTDPDLADSLDASGSQVQDNTSSGSSNNSTNASNPQSINSNQGQANNANRIPLNHSGQDRTNNTLGNRAAELIAETNRTVLATAAGTRYSPPTSRTPGPVVRTNPPASDRRNLSAGSVSRGTPVGGSSNVPSNRSTGGNSAAGPPRSSSASGVTDQGGGVPGSRTGAGGGIPRADADNSTTSGSSNRQEVPVLPPEAMQGMQSALGNSHKPVVGDQEKLVLNYELSSVSYTIGDGTPVEAESKGTNIPVTWETYNETKVGSKPTVINGLPIGGYWYDGLTRYWCDYGGSQDTARFRENFTGKVSGNTITGKIDEGSFSLTYSKDTNGERLTGWREDGGARKNIYLCRSRKMTGTLSFDFPKVLNFLSNRFMVEKSKVPVMVSANLKWSPPFEKSYANITALDYTNKIIEEHHEQNAESASASVSLVEVEPMFEQSLSLVDPSKSGANSLTSVMRFPKNEAEFRSTQIEFENDLKNELKVKLVYLISYNGVAFAKVLVTYKYASKEDQLAVRVSPGVVEAVPDNSKWIPCHILLRMWDRAPNANPVEIECRELMNKDGFVHETMQISMTPRSYPLLASIDPKDMMDAMVHGAEFCHPISLLVPASMKPGSYPLHFKIKQAGFGVPVDASIVVLVKSGGQVAKAKPQTDRNKEKSIGDTVSKTVQTRPHTGNKLTKNNNLQEITGWQPTPSAPAESTRTQPPLEKPTEPAATKPVEQIERGTDFSDRHVNWSAFNTPLPWVRQAQSTQRSPAPATPAATEPAATEPAEQVERGTDFSDRHVNWSAFNTPLPWVRQAQSTPRSPAPATPAATEPAATKPVEQVERGSDFSDRHVNWSAFNTPLPWVRQAQSTPRSPAPNSTTSHPNRPVKSTPYTPSRANSPTQATNNPRDSRVQAQGQTLSAGRTYYYCFKYPKQSKTKLKVILQMSNSSVQWYCPDDPRIVFKGKINGAYIDYWYDTDFDSGRGRLVAESGGWSGSHVVTYHKGNLPSETVSVELTPAP